MLYRFDLYVIIIKSGGIIMPNIELTETLRTTIRTLRKEKKKRGDELSKELGKGASYISQIENGKIKEIDFDLLDNILRRITDLQGDAYSKYISNIIDNSISHMTKEELQHEEWMHQFDFEIRQYPIQDSVITYIKEHLSSLNYTPKEFVEIINQNRGLKNVPDAETLEPNKIKINIIDHGNGSYHVQSTIKFDLPLTFVEDILSKKKTTISYINMEGILYNLFLSESCPEELINEKCKIYLKDHGFLTIKERNKRIRDSIKQKNDNNEHFTFYDVQPTDYDKQYVMIREDIDNGFDFLRDKNLAYAIKKLKQLSLNMHDDLGFTTAIMSSPLSKIPADKKKDFWSKYKDLLQSYIDDSNTDNNIL